MWTF
jgi:hypothetical protein